MTFTYIYPVHFCSGVQTYASIPVNLNGTFIGHTDDVGDIDYNDFICKMDEYRLGRRLDVGEQHSNFKGVVSQVAEKVQSFPPNEKF
jgi:hypothetical protein